MCALGYMNPLVGMAMCLKSFLFWYLLCLVIVKSLAPVIYIHTIYFVVTLAIFHLRAPPTLDVGDPISCSYAVRMEVAVRSHRDRVELCLVSLCAGVVCTPCPFV